MLGLCRPDHPQSSHMWCMLLPTLQTKEARSQLRGRAFSLEPSSLYDVVMRMDLKSMLMQWALMFLINATDGSEVRCSQNKELVARGINSITCHTGVKGGRLSVNVTFLPDDTQLPPGY